MVLAAIVGKRLHTPAAQRACAVPVEAPVELLDRIPVRVGAPAKHAQGERVGEVSQHAAVLQARLTLDGKVRSGDVLGCSGVGAFALSTREDFGDAVRTSWRSASPKNDYMIKVRIEDLEPGTRYYYRLLSGPEPSSAEAGPTGTFRTLDRRGVTREVRFVVVTGMNQFAFLASTIKDLAFRERSLGFPGLAAITAREPDFFVSTGDSVYYDTPYVGRAETQDEMRAKWHRQFAAPRFAALFQQVATYWQKDDHDYRYEDADPHGSFEPSARLGADVFLEQVPLADPGDEQPLTYRTHRVNDLLQIWLLEGREHRDANTAPAGHEKTMWGTEQKAWLRETLLASDATFKIIISPTPLVGPDDEAKGVQGGILAPFFGGKPLGQGDDMRKMDNHANAFGYREEGNALFAWLADQGFLEKNLYLVCGDRHWQYHSVHPSGFEEFSVGALVDANSRLGPSPGDANSTDPEGLIIQPYSQAEASGGFLEVNVRPAEGGQPATAEFAFYDEHGLLLHSVAKAATTVAEQ
jgi:alkaline phosphatase/alkaline phosphatase D